VFAVSFYNLAAKNRNFSAPHAALDPHLTASFDYGRQPINHIGAVSTL